jgi:methylated-DNA-[protein]-cysteine S-methyltransferase
MKAMADTGYCLFDTAIGACGIAWTGGAIASCQLPERDRDATMDRMSRRHPDWSEAAPPFWVQEVMERVQALLGGARDDLADVPLDWSGQPDFNRRVFEITRAIPPGRTLTYGDIAKQLGDIGASRAVGQALGHNPYAPIVPCHRVLGAGNSGTGFSATGGVATKLKMLEIERAQLGTEPGLFD